MNEQRVFQRRSLGIIATAKKLRGNPEGIVGMVMIAAVCLTAITAPLIAPYNPVKLNLKIALQPPSLTHFMGTDNYGRDIFSRIIYGSQLDLQIAIAVVAIALPLGAFAGIFSGYRGGRIDEVLMRVTDLFLAFPDLILALTVSVLLGRGIVNLIIALSFTFWTPYARLARAQTLQVKKEVYVEAANAVGASDRRIMFRHVLPVVVPPLFVHAALQTSQVILSAATLGFLGLGAQPPAPEWGLQISNGLSYLTTSWWISFFPGIAIIFTTLAFNLLGDSVRDILDIRSTR